jgi:hypothetical protein
MIKIFITDFLFYRKNIFKKYFSKMFALKKNCVSWKTFKGFGIENFLKIKF